MTQPQTNFELTGGWTTLAQEEAFLNQIVSETALTEHLAGHSVENRPIRYFTIGEGVENTILLSSMVHGNEQASREALLIKLRDVCYSSDPDMLAYLQTHRIVWLPNSNPDRTLQTRFNAANVDPNRDRFMLLQPETLAVVTVVNETAPNLVIDCHEYYTAGRDWWCFQSHLPGAYPAVRSLEEEIFQAGLLLMADNGYTAMQYPMGGVPRSCTTAYTTSRHAVSITSETNGMYGEPTVRVGVHKLFLDFILEWHADNSGRCAQARADSLAWASESTGTDLLMIRETYIGHDTPEPVRLAGYQLQEPLPQRLVDFHGIIVDEYGFVSMNQEARLVIPQILDPAAMDRQVEAVRVARVDPDPEPEPEPPREPLPNRPLLGQRVHVGGRTREVIGMKVKINGRVRDVLMPGQ